jgi:heme-degrading monooxygenase HmoA
MYYVRLSLLKPRPGHEADVAAMMDDLVGFYRSQRGFVTGYKLTAADETGDIGRVTVWRSEADADEAAQTTHVLSRRSELASMTLDESREERGFHAEDESSPLVRLVHRLRPPFA